MKNDGLLEDKGADVFEEHEAFDYFLHRSRVGLLCHGTDADNDCSPVIHDGVVVQLIILAGLIL